MRPRTTAALVVILYFHVIRRTLSFCFWRGTFKYGARGYTIVSACAGGWAVEHTEAIKRGRPKTIMISVELLILNFINRRFSFTFRNCLEFEVCGNEREQSPNSILQLLFCQPCCQKLVRESSLFYRFAMDPANENNDNI